MRLAGPRRALAAVGTCAAISVLAGCGADGVTPTALLDAGEDTSSGPVAVSPQPGTPDASPTTQISFLGGAGTRVLRVSVTGSRSGIHEGRLEAYSTGTGESFLPYRRFEAGEQVLVHALVDDHGRRVRVYTYFTVADQATYARTEFPEEPGDAADIQHYLSAPAITPSTVTITVPPQHGAAPGDLLLAPYQGLGAAGPMITTQSGRLLWFHRLPRGIVATNLHVARYEGKPVLVWWQGSVLELGFGEGEDVIYDDHYRRIATIHAGNGYHADLHSLLVTKQGTAWIDAFDPVREDLASVGGEAEGAVSDSVVQEIDIRTGLVMWEWHALGHIPLTESHTTPPTSVGGGALSTNEEPWDYVHINSIDPLPDGQVLLSARNTWALYDVQMRGGGVRWRLGGDHSDFRQLKGTKFYWQHDATLQGGGRISLFDNGSDPPMQASSLALLLRVNTAAHTVRLLHAYRPHENLLASSQGSMQALGGGDWMVGYGGLPNFIEYGSHGHILFAGTLGKGVQSFRTYLQEWSGQPQSRPALAVRGAAGGAQLYFSWNGATDVQRWRILAGATRHALKQVGEVGDEGFQTSFTFARRPRFVAVQALGGHGSVLAASRVARG
ncbi:MAG TPA: arylsulfotransferase family protein [Solirubrobacteraceae bacterium]|nr:arylsulfotransferase family protein [Solirubrobacteraceae bacterium]